MPETFSVGYSGTGSWASGGNNNLQITITKCTVTWTYATTTCGGTSTVLVTRPVSVGASGVAVPPTAPNTSWPVGSSAYLQVKLVMYSSETTPYPSFPQNATGSAIVTGVGTNIPGTNRS